MQLLRDEEDALFDLVEGMPPNLLDHHLFRAVRVRTIQFVGANVDVLTLTLAFISWLKLHGQHAPAILQRLVTAFPSHPSTPALTIALARLQAAQARVPAGPPQDVVLAGGFPVVDRIGLRSHLADLVAGYDRPVVVVDGARGLGRSHSWILIRYVADRLGPAAVRPLWLDLVGPVLSQQTLPHLFRHLVKVLGLPDGPDPTVEGATGTTLADRFVGEFLARVQQMPAGWAVTPWLVFDHLDRQLAPEIKLFVAGLVDLRLNGAISGCVIFLLGPDPQVSFSDPARLARRETLTDFLDGEIDAAARSLNVLGARPLPTPDLLAEIETLKALRAGHVGRELAVAVCSGLVDLREKVGA